MIRRNRHKTIGVLWFPRLDVLKELRADVAVFARLVNDFGYEVGLSI